MPQPYYSLPVPYPSCPRKLHIAVVLACQPQMDVGNEQWQQRWAGALASGAWRPGLCGPRLNKSHAGFVFKILSAKRVEQGLDLIGKGEASSSNIRPQ